MRGVSAVSGGDMVARLGALGLVFALLTLNTEAVGRALPIIGSIVPDLVRKLEAGNDLRGTSRPCS